MSTAAKRVLATSLNLWAIEAKLRSAVIVASVGTLMIMFYPKSPTMPTPGMQSSYSGFAPTTAPMAPSMQFTDPSTMGMVSAAPPALSIQPSITSGKVEALPATESPQKDVNTSFGSIKSEDIQAIKMAAPVEDTNKIKPSFSLH